MELPKSGPDRSRLTVPREQLERELADQIAKGHGFRAPPIASRKSLLALAEKVDVWDDFNVELLQKRFISSEIADEYRAAGSKYLDDLSGEIGAAVDAFHEFMRAKVYQLTSVKTRLKLFDEPAPTRDKGFAAPTDPPGARDRIFVVHGHNRALKQEVLRFVEHVTEMEVVVLHEQPNGGKTVIEKFEEHAGRVAFAIVLLTGDDPVPGGTDAIARPRQNVVFELGFFFGHLGRESVAALYEPKTELPSDISGVLYTELDERGAWKFELGREMRAAGIEVDMNRAV